MIARGENHDQTWANKLDFIIRHQGLALMLTHPDYLNQQTRFDVYRGFLDRVSQQANFWHGLPSELTRWWRRRERAAELGASGLDPSEHHHESNPIIWSRLNQNSNGLTFLPFEHSGSRSVI